MFALAIKSDRAVSVPVLADKENAPPLSGQKRGRDSQDLFDMATTHRPGRDGSASTFKPINVLSSLAEGVFRQSEWGLRE